MGVNEVDVKSNRIPIRISIALAGALLAVTMSGCAAKEIGSAEESVPTGVPAAGSIAYVGLDENIYLIDPAGGSPRPVTDDAASGGSDLRRYQDPTWDPSTGSLAFIEL